MITACIEPFLEAQSLVQGNKKSMALASRHTSTYNSIWHFKPSAFHFLSSQKTKQKKTLAETFFL